MNTIFAVSSGAPPAAIAVLRISGPDALTAATFLAGELPQDRRATLRTLRDSTGMVLDRALLLVFRGPATATGEDLVELHLHGGRAVVAAVEHVLSIMPGLRCAEAGEFTRRALINNRIDLTEAEGFGDLLAAETEGQRRVAMMAAEGGIRRRIEQWSDRLLQLSARVEAELDFSDEDDVHEGDTHRIVAEVAMLQADIEEVLAQPPIERLQDGIRIVLAGPPNSGKSSLLNVLANRDAAIVSPIAGTTRDRIEVPVSRNGIAYLLTDTAGLTDSDDPIERIGVERARQAINTADVILWLGDAVGPDKAIWVHSRADLPKRQVKPAEAAVSISAMTGVGMEFLWEHIEARATAALPRSNEVVLNQRQRDLAVHANAALKRGASNNTDPLLLAEDLREARGLLHRITGHSDTDAMLDALFGKFCIGK